MTVISLTSLKIQSLGSKEFILSSGNRIKLPSTEYSTPLEAYASIYDILSCAFSSIRDQFYKGDFVFQGINLSFLYNTLKHSEHLSGSYFTSLLIERTSKRVFDIEKNEKLIFPYENRSWEKRLVKSARAKGVKRIIAYQHSSITPRHLSFKVTNKNLCQSFLPDKIITAGKVTYDWLKINSPVLSEMVVSGVSLRRVTKHIGRLKNQSVLVPISSSRDEASALLNLVKRATEVSKVNFIIRTHPTIPIDDLFNQYDWSGKVQLSTDMTLEQDLERTSIVVYSSSTVAIDGMLLGMPVIFADIGDIPSGDPLLDNDSLRVKVKSGEELACEVDRLFDRPGDIVVSQQKKSKEYAESYLVSVSEFSKKDLAELFEVDFSV